MGNRRTPSWLSNRLLCSALDLVRSAAGGIAMEYGLLVALIAVAILGTVAQLGGALVNLPLPALANALAGAVS